MGSYIYLGTNMCVCVCVCVCVCTSHVYVYHLKNTPATAGDIRDAGSVPWLGRSLEGGHGDPVQYSCLENPMDRGARETTDHSHKELDMTDACTHAHHLKEVQFSSVTQSCPTLCDPADCSPTRLLSPWDSPGKNTGLGCHFLLQGIFQMQGSNPGLPHCRQTLLPLSHEGSPTH